MTSCLSTWKTKHYNKKGGGGGWGARYSYGNEELTHIGKYGKNENVSVAFP